MGQFDGKGWPTVAPGFVVMAENGCYGVQEKLVERYGRVGGALYTFVVSVT